ncbi:di-heme oxidoredictase family protein [Methylocystis sp. IM2]|uniref:di-heme oxidoredictase family protein n=1 Tax=Methylocystis sp. IM2 TaxID=3136563 RepID=UPI0030F5E0AC
MALAGAARYETQTPETEALSQPLPGLEAAQSASFRRGLGLFRQAWLVGPSEDHPDLIGLGPLYNRLSCIACHVKNGRGAAPDPENGVARHTSKYVRLLMVRGDTPWRSCLLPKLWLNGAHSSRGPGTHRQGKGRRCVPLMF